MSNNNGKGREIFYGVIGVATLVVAIIGATFAYFTASASNNTTITGDAASINFGLAVTRAETNDTAGLIPMSNSMVHPAVTNASGNGICLDDNGNAVCQIYKIVVTNNSSATIFLDGYVDLTGGLADTNDYSLDLAGVTGSPTTTTAMRWAQVFCTETAGLSCTTTGNSTVTTTVATTLASIDAPNTTDTNGFNTDNIKTSGVTTNSAITGAGTSTYEVINQNYIRISGHTAGAVYNHDADVKSALVFNQNLAPTGADTGDVITYYIAVWLTETSTNQNPTTENPGEDFFGGTVTFISGAGSEVTASFNGYTRVAPTDTNTVESGT